MPYTPEAYVKSLKIHNRRQRMLGKYFKQTLSELVKRVTNRHPEFQSLSWDQWTPGFNDGDPCYNQLGYHKACDVEGNEVEFYEGDKGKGKPAWAVDLLESVLNPVIFSMDWDILENLFGTDLTITVDREGEFSTEECYRGY